MASNNKRRNRIITIVLLAAVLAMAAYKYFENQNKPKGEAVTFEKVKDRTIMETVSASGRIFPEKEVKISSDVSGEIIKLYVAEGDSVKAGQTLVKINPDAYVSNVARTSASVNAAKSGLEQAKSQVQGMMATKQQLEEQVSNAKKNYERNQQLFKDGVISQVELDQTYTSLASLEANVKNADANIKAAQDAVEGAQYNVKGAEASLNEMNTNLSRTLIKAPVSGIISSLSVEQGERVVGTMQMSGTEIMRIANLNQMEVQVDVSENDIISVSLRDSVDIEVDAYLEKTFKGVVSEISNSASNIGSSGLSMNTDQVTNFVVKVRMDPKSYENEINSENLYPFRPGMSASVDIYTNKEESIPSIPIQAVTTRKDTTQEKEVFDEVVFLHSADTVKMVKVKTGIQDDEFIQILSGLSTDDEIVSGPYSAISKRLEEGTNVRKKEEKKDKKKKK